MQRLNRRGRTKRPTSATHRRHISVMHSVPNYIPVAPAVINDIRDRLVGIEFDDLYGFTWGLNIIGNVRQAVDDSFRRYLTAIGGCKTALPNAPSNTKDTMTDKLEPAELDRYLHRLGIARRPDATSETLELLHRTHLALVPFENLDLHVGRRVELDQTRFVSKIVDNHRGGFCYELNGAFALLLAALGFKVDLLEARVHGDSGPNRPFDHLCLRVSLEQPWLVDVGFGDSFDAPIPLEATGDHLDTNGVFRVEAVDDEWTDLHNNAGPQYRFSTTARTLADFAPGCDFHQTPASHFLRNTICSRRTLTGRITLRALTLIDTTHGVRNESAVEPAELHDTLVRQFGIDLNDEDIARLRSASGT
jgi:N-hydroxyarylamine O-acetyltransferase